MSGTTIMRCGFADALPHTDSQFRWVGTVNGVELDTTWDQPSSFAFWIPGNLMARVTAVQLLRSIPPGTLGAHVELSAFGPAEPYTFGNTAGMIRYTPVTFTGQFAPPNDFRAVLRAADAPTPRRSQSTGRVNRRSIEFGESFAWQPPANAASYFVWTKRASTADAAPRWSQRQGYDITAASDIMGIADPLTLVLRHDGFTVDWAALLELFDGFDAEVAMVTALDDNGRLVERTVIALPAPNSTDASAIAAEERRILKTLLAQRADRSELGGYKSQADPSGTAVEFIELGALDKRIAEVRARIAWFEEAARGNPLPRLEAW